jgi:2-polyprenyl-3-methyl-5-hydroxy-6-metoxy-1,4-benzoquinol methylase
MAATSGLVGYWESVAERRLGRYITSVERRALEQGMSLRPVPDTALEIGCGGGRWSRIPAAQGYRMICTEVDEASLEECQRRIPDARCILTSPAQHSIPCESESVGLLFCFEVEPVTGADWFAREAARVLKPGAVMVTSFLNSNSIRGLAHRALGHSAGDAAFYRHSYVSRRKQLRAAGFSMIEEYGCCWLPFSRASDSPLVEWGVRLERFLGLRHLPALSPWIIVLAQKTQSPR